MKNSPQKISLLTGAAGGIGTEIALQLDKEGYQQVLIDINQSGLEKLASKLVIPPLCIATDITNVNNVIDIRTQVLEKFKRIDVLINNAGVVLTTPFYEAEYKAIESEFNVNYKSCIYFLREIVPIMKSQGYGHIISISSLGGIMPLREAPGYCGSKFGLRGYMLSLSLALKTFGIKATTIYPTAIDTKMLQHEAVHGGSLMNFVSEPLKPIQVAKAVIKAIDKSPMELAVPKSAGFICKLMGYFPSQIPFFLKILEPVADRNRLNYIKEKNLLQNKT